MTRGIKRDVKQDIERDIGRHPKWRASEFGFRKESLDAMNLLAVRPEV
jgi:hypothetical protein